MLAMALDARGGALTPHTLPMPEPRAGEVRVRIAAAALNPADLKVKRGGFDGRILHASRFPLVLGYDFAGTVDAVGEGADLAVGTPVFGHLPYSSGNGQGTLAEAVVVAAASVAPCPGLDPVKAAAAATVGCTALQSIADRVPSGGRVWINGASGGVGSLAVQIARRLEAEVWATCSAAKAALVTQLGAQHVLDYREAPLPSGVTFDVILDAAATQSFARTRHLLGPRGVYVTTLPDPRFVWGALLAAFSSKSNKFVVVKSRRDDLSRLAAWLTEGGMQVPVDAVFPLAEAEAALARLAAGPVGKVAVQVS